MTLGEDTYCEREVADTWHARSPYGVAWAQVEVSRREQLLMVATTMMDSYVEFEGAATRLEQPLAWPRYGVFTRQGDWIDDEAIPVELQHATAELALALDARDLREDSDLVDLGVSSAEGVALSPIRRVIPSRVVELLPECWVVRVRGSGKPGAIPLRRG